MSEHENQESQKTIVAFAAGLLIGGLLVWVFGGDSAKKAVENKAEDTSSGDTIKLETKEDETDSEQPKTDTVVAPVMQVGDAKVSIKDQAAGSKAVLESITFPTDEGWVGVRDYKNGQASGLLGVARYSKEQGLIPSEIILQRPTTAGSEYAVVFYKESGDRKFSSKNDTLMEGIAATFKAN
jgi:hypothetical protein